MMQRRCEPHHIAPTSSHGSAPLADQCHRGIHKSAWLCSSECDPTALDSMTTSAALVIGIQHAADQCTHRRFRQTIRYSIVGCTSSVKPVKQQCETSWISNTDYQRQTQRSHLCKLKHKLGRVLHHVQSKFFLPLLQQRCVRCCRRRQHPLQAKPTAAAPVPPTLPKQHNTTAQHTI